ncbi:Protein of unknown function [Pyronema omphalodes CBS 100304]|uniref:Uncharacterized protein n=1 Tax=Pyronema omphalodes (strain CBS 100304) TaxID=1076935 RepID=U4LGG9_PYROM|nr:Protein of unknown function [Pyronema omphalodes CBS 100304]
MGIGIGRGLNTTIPESANKLQTLHEFDSQHLRVPFPIFCNIDI